MLIAAPLLHTWGHAALQLALLHPLQHHDMPFDGYTREGSDVERAHGLLGTGDVGRLDKTACCTSPAAPTT